MIDFRETVEWLKEDGFCDATAIGFGEKTAVTALFPYRLERPTAVSAAASYIDPFALRNNYREMAARLKTAAIKIRKAAGLNKSEVRIFVNSSLPEKAAAAFAGLGFCGKSTLLISPLYGVNTLIGGILISLPAADGLSRFDGAPPSSAARVPSALSVKTALTAAAVCKVLLPVPERFPRNCCRIGIFFTVVPAAATPVRIAASTAEASYIAVEKSMKAKRSANGCKRRRRAKKRFAPVSKGRRWRCRGLISGRCCETL